MVVSRTKLLAAGCVAALAVSLTACGSDSGGGSGGSGSSELSAEAKAGMETAKAAIEKYQALPTFTPPGEAFDAKAVMAGKTIASIPVNAGTDFSLVYAKKAVSLAEEIGFKFETWQNAGSPAEWAKGIEHAVSTKANVIDLFAGIDPQLVAPQITKAQGAKIPVVASDTYDVTQTPDASLDGSINCPCSEAARLNADWVTVETKGVGHVLFISSSDVTASAASQDAFKDELSKVGPEIQAKYIDVPVADWATKIIPQVQSALVADPKIEYVVPVFDSMSTYVIQAIQQTGRTGKTFIATYNGTPSMLKLMGEGDFIRMNVGQSNDWMTSLILDQEMRIAAGMPANPDATWGLRIWTKDNLSEAGSPPVASKGYGEDYIKGFAELWGLN